MKDDIKAGDIVGRKSHNCDILFKIDSIVVKNGIPLLCCEELI